MNDDTARLSIVWQVLRQRWRLLIVIAVLGALVGAGASLVFSPGYETSASVLLQGSRDPDELLTEAQVAKSSVVLDRAAAALNWGKSGLDLQESVNATVADGNIIEITSVEETPERAQRLADRIAQEYVTFSTQLLSNSADASAQVSQEQQQTLRQQIIETNQKISDLHSSAGEGNTIDSVGVRTELESLRTALSQAVAKLDELDSVSSQAKMVVMGPAERPAGPGTPTMTHFVAGGAAVFFLLGMFGHLLSTRADRRLRGEAPIVAALGTTVLGGIDVPDEVAAPPTGPVTFGRRLRRLVVDDKPWHLIEQPAAPDEASMVIRYRRVLNRLREQTPEGPATVLVVVADDDQAASLATARLASTPSDGPGRITLRVVEVSAERPTVPEDTVAGVLVVVTSGTRTAWELVGITEACNDAGHDVLGVVVTHRTRPPEQDIPTDVAPEVPAGVLAGTA